MTPDVAPGACQVGALPAPTPVSRYPAGLAANLATAPAPVPTIRSPAVVTVERGIAPVWVAPGRPCAPWVLREPLPPPGTTRPPLKELIASWQAQRPPGLSRQCHRGGPRR